MKQRKVERARRARRDEEDLRILTLDVLRALRSGGIYTRVTVDAGDVLNKEPEGGERQLPLDPFRIPLHEDYD